MSKKFRIAVSMLIVIAFALTVSVFAFAGDRTTGISEEGAPGYRSVTGERTNTDVGGRESRRHRSGDHQYRRDDRDDHGDRGDNSGHNED